MKIEVRSKDCLYVELNGYVYYIDDSTNEQIIEVKALNDVSFEIKKGEIVGFLGPNGYD